MIVSKLQGVGPKWLLHTLGSLYWRIKGNPRNALACLQVALDSCPWQFRDIVLISQGAVLHRLGQIDEALVAITEALSIKSDEVNLIQIVSCNYNFSP